MKYPNTFNEVDFEKYMIEAEPVAKVLPAYAWQDKINDILANGSVLTGAKLPWSKTHYDIRFRPSEVTLWQGINGHGKSQILGMACLWFIKQGEGVCIASFEMKPELTYLRMLRQAATTDRPSVQFSDQLLEWSDDKFYIYDHLGAVQPERIYAAIKYAAIELKLKHFVIDNLMKCIRGEDDYSGQKAFVDRICALARELNIHVHLVHHVRKGQSENDIPTKFDARGSGTITDQVDQILTVWRNKKKHEKLATNPKDPDFVDKPDALLVCDKNRHGQWEGNIALWHHDKSLQYTPDKRNMPIPLLDDGDL
jgi:twinkle protein